MTNFYAIHSSAVARELMRRGFRMIDVVPNKKKPSFSVYRFEDSIELQMALMEIFDRKDK